MEKIELIINDDNLNFNKKLNRIYTDKNNKFIDFLDIFENYILSLYNNQF